MPRRSREQWQALVDEQNSSGLTAADFCKQHNINEKYFSTVKHKLKHPSATAPSGFTRVKPTHPLASVLNISYGNVQLSIPVTVEPGGLARFVQAMGE